MARKSDIRLRRSAVSGSVPGGADLNLGELALNTADGAIFVKNGAGNIVTVSHDGILHYDEPNSRIGIGTSTPAVDLHVVSGDGSTIGGAHMNRATLLLGTTTSGMALDVNEICVAGDDLFLETLGNNDIKFRTNGTQVKMIVKGNGNVGVGFSDPKERFSIGNKINFHDGGHKLIAFGFNPSDSNKATATGYPADLRYDPASGDLRFEIDSTQRANGDVSATSNRLILKGSGDVLVPAGSLGIDVSTPYAKLQVNDTVFDGTHGVHADSRVNIASHGSLQAIQYASTYNSANYPDYGMVFVHGPSTSSYNVWSISPDGPAKGDSLNFIYGSNTSNIHTITPKVVFDGNGNVGIGTETPRAKLDVNGSINVEQATSIALDSDTYADTAILIPRGTGIRSNTTGDYQRNLLSHNGTSGNGALQIGQQGTSIITDVLVYPGSSGNIRFFPSGSEDVRFDISGNVGIGNTNPVARLDVAGEDAGPSGIFHYGYATNEGIRVFGNESAIDIVGNDNGNHASSLLLRNSNEGFALVNNASSNRLEFRSFTSTANDFKVHHTGTNVNNLVDILTLEKTGNVGIGTNSPSELLEVAGDTKVTNLGVNAGPQDYLSSLSARLTVGGNAVINTNSPILYLRANGTSNNSDLRFQNGLKFTNGSAAIRAIIDDSGNFGIGTDTPETQLHVAHGSDTSAAVHITGGHAGRRLKIQSFQSGGADGAGFLFDADSSYGALKFQTTSTDRMVITQPGSVGIGTSDPNRQLHVYQPNGTNVVAQFESNDAQVWIDLQDSNSGSYGCLIGHDTAADHLFMIADSNVSRKLVIDNDGNVGIGDTSPAHKLTVSAPNNTTAVGIDIGSNAHFDFQANSTSGYTTTFYMDDTGLEIGHDSASRNLALQTSNTDRLVIAGSGAITFNNAYTFPTSIGSSGQILKVPTSGTQLIWGNETASAPLQIIDTDGDTKIQVEESADEDIIRFDTAGTQRLAINASGDILMSGGDLRYTGGINWDIAHHGAGQNIVFHTTPTGGSATRRMRIDDQGNVGIGTDSMTYKFEVHGNLASSLRARVVNAGNGQSSLDLKTADQETRLIAVNGKSFYVYNQTTNTEPFTILSGGNVGIDFTSPDDRLHVKGGIRTHSASESKYIKILGGNTGNFIDSHGTTLYIRPGGNTGTATSIDASGNVGIGANLTVAGNLTVQGTTTTLNTATLDVEDLNITVAKGAADKAAADGAGITIDCGSDPDATFTYDGGQDRFKFNREIHTSNGIRIEQSSPYLVLKDTSDDDDHAIRLTANNNSTVYQIDSAGDNFNFRTYGTRGINLLTGDIQRFSVGDGGNVHFYKADGTASRMRWDATNEKLIIGSGDRLSLDTAVTINPSNGNQKVYSLISSDIGSENLGFAMKGDDTTDRMSFFTDYNTSGTYAERMSIIAETGRVGINQSAPAAQFHVYSNTTSAPAMLIRNDSASAGGRGLLIQHDNGGAGTDRYALKVVTAFGSSDINALVVDGNGHVGMGTDTPVKPLHVQFSGDNGIRIESEDNHASLYIDSHTARGQYIRFTEENSNKYWIQSTGGKLVFRPGATGTVANQVIFDDSGSVGIGYTSPGARLHVRSGSDDLVSIFESTDNKSYIAIKDDDTSGYIGAENGKLSLGGQGGVNAANLNIDVSTGNVGIGIITANYKLHVVESTQNAGAINVSDGTSWMRMVPNLGGSGFNPLSTAGDMGIIFSTDDASGSDGTGGFLIAPHSNNKSGIKIRENGNIGLGTHAPAARLHVMGWANNASNLATSASNAKVKFQNSDNSSLSSYEGYTGNSWYQQIANGAGTTPYKLSLNPYGGNVGIGTANPSQKLHVAGITRLNVFNHKNGIFSPITSASGNNYIGTLDTGSNGDGGGGTLIVYDGQSRSTRVIDIAIRNSSGTSAVTCSVTGSGGGGDVDIQLRHVERSNDASKIDFFLASSGGKLFTQYYYWTTSHYVDDSGSSPSSSGATTVDLDDAMGVFTKENSYVGIGETNPGAKFQVNSSGTIGWSNLANAFILAGTTTSGIGIDNNEIMAKGSGHLYFGTTDSGSDVVIRAGGTGAAVTVDGSNQRVGIAKSEPLARFQVEEYGIDTSSATTTATTQVAIHTFPITDFRSARFTIQITNTTDSTYHSTEILAIHDGTTANITEFGEVHTGSSVEATFDADINSGNFRLLATPTSTNSMTFKVVCHSLTV